MIRRRYLSTRLLEENMVIDQAIVDRSGRILIARKTPLDAFLIDALQKMNVSGIYIREGEEDPEEHDIEISPNVAKTIETQTVEDRSKVRLSESVKKRVSEGMQYLYCNTSSTGFTQAANAISDDLLDAIMENNALALDVNTLRVSDEYTFRHSVDVATISMIMAKKAGLPREEIRQVGIAGLLHDIGKSLIPKEILNKTGRLSHDEFLIMKKHPLLGYDILKNKKELSPEIIRGALQHHEKMNGQGYPLGLTAPQIGPYARILSVADIYDALVTERPYKKSFSQRDSVEILMTMTEELDMEALKSFLGSIILYPVGSTVTLSNGERARVVQNNSNYPLRPRVVGLRSGKVYDLSGDIHCASIIIE